MIKILVKEPDWDNYPVEITKFEVFKAYQSCIKVVDIDEWCDAIYQIMKNNLQSKSYIANKGNVIDMIKGYLLEQIGEK